MSPTYIALLALVFSVFAFTAQAQPVQRIVGESLVLAGTQPGNLLGSPLSPEKVVVRSHYLPDPKATVYEAGRDYVINAKAATIARTENSRIPDFSKNVLYGKKDFNHGQYPGYGNGPFLIFVDYETANAPALQPDRVQVETMLPKTVRKFREHKPVRIIAYGDSITAGGEASSVDLQYPSRWAEYLRKEHPGSKIELLNHATGGDNTENGLARLQEKVLSQKPDLVLIAFGMNDHNLLSVGGVPVAKFKENLKSMAKQIRQKTDAEVILLSCFPPNPDWHFGSHQMEKYAEATKEAADELNAPYADVYGIWETVLKRKDEPSLLGNDINHPNDFGHWLYLQALEALRF